MTLNATLNPDFSQVETDQLQLNFNDGFALFYQEKRPFFLEGADYFSSQFNVLYTRQIADPDFGLRLTGRTSSGAYGAIVARDAPPCCWCRVCRAPPSSSWIKQPALWSAAPRHDFNKQLSVGVIGTFRRGDDYANNVAVDARWRQGPHQQFCTASPNTRPASWMVIRMNWATICHAVRQCWRAQYAFSNRNWNLTAWRMAISPGFRADLGFMGQVGYEKSLLGGGHNWYRDDKAFNRINVYADFDITHRFDGRLLERELEGKVNVQDPCKVGLHALTRSRFGRAGCLMSITLISAAASGHSATCRWA